MKRLPVDVSNFELMIKGDYLYIDKTKNIYELITNARLFFLSRPRRFGKSLLISTLKELFSGNKELFKDLWIGKHSDYEWKKYPVIQLDFSNLSHESDKKFTNELMFELDKTALKYDVDLSLDTLVGDKLITLVEALAKRNKVVILIDECDSPIVNNVNNFQAAKSIQRVRNHFLSVIKGLDARGHIHAIFIASVTNIARSSIFSGMNNLNDVTMNPEASALLGFTHQELLENFRDHIDALAGKNNLTTWECIESINDWYAGYRFSRSETYVYNPCSIMHCFDKGHIANYWLETGTSQFLIEVWKKNIDSIVDITKLQVSSGFLGVFDFEELPFFTILYQSGYLSIADYNAIDSTHTLGYPNKEVKKSFDIITSHYQLKKTAYSSASFNMKNKKLTLDWNEQELKP